MQKNETIKVEDLKGFVLVEKFRNLIDEKLQKRNKDQVHKSELDPRRTLTGSNFYTYLLFVMFNPVLKSARSIVTASHYKKVQDSLNVKSISLGSFSDAQNVFSADILHKVFKEISASMPTHVHQDDHRLENAVKKLVAVDGSLFDALPRMTWALYRNQTENRKFKLHLLLNIENDSIQDAIITNGKACERKEFEKMIQPGCLYTADRYYGLEYSFFDKIVQKKADFLIRIRENSQYEIQENYCVDTKSQTYGVISDQRIRLKNSDKEYRLVIIERNGKTLYLLSNRYDLDSDLVGMIYEKRWQIELFFKWLKCILKCEHLILESPNGVACQIYTALILALLLTYYAGKKPSKRVMEALQLYLLGFVSIEELNQIISKK